VDPNASVAGLARAIPLSVDIFTGRLSRMIDRVRFLQDAQHRVDPSQSEDLERALQVQRRRT
jgi:hypothetical protein